MTSNRAFLLAALALLASACGPSHPSNPSGGTTMPPRQVTRPVGGGHTMALTVNGSTCASGSYVNKPCVEVTVCEPSPSATCYAIGDVLLDTGSYGLRLFKSVVPLNLPAATIQVGAVTGTLASCVSFADGSADWGPVRIADIYLGDAGPVPARLQVIDASFGTVPLSCGQADTSPAQAGLNGILGIGPYLEDCGSGCVGDALNGLYYGCVGNACSGVAVPLSEQIQNPAALLTGLDNGLVVDLPAVGAGGAPSVSGQVYFGIGSSAETNTLGGVTAYPVTPGLKGIPSVGQKVNTVVGTGFMDTGSNALYFNPSSAGTSLTGCTAPYTGFYCSDATLNAQFLVSGTTYGTGFTMGVVNLHTLLTNGSSNVFPGLGGTLPGLTLFDWGLPIYLGRKVYQGYETRTSSLGTGPYQAF